MSHTPGPWHIKRKKQSDYEHLYISHDSPTMSAIVADLHCPLRINAAGVVLGDNPRILADAAVIVVAPDLLGSLEKLADWGRRYDAQGTNGLAVLVADADNACAVARGNASIRLAGQWLVERKKQSDYEHLYICREEPMVSGIVADLHSPTLKDIYENVTPNTRKLADAALIAAAPCLLASLEAVVDWACEHTSPRDADSPHDLLVAARGLIDTARGKAPPAPEAPTANHSFR